MNHRKSFFSHSVEAALAQARREFGDEAYLVDSRSSRPEQRHLGAFEVVIEADSVGSPESVPATARPMPAWPDLAAEVGRLREELRRMAELMYRPAAFERALTDRPAFAEVAACLAAAELPQEIALELLEAAASRGPSVAVPLLDMTAELCGRLSTGRTILHSDQQAVIALVGPAGAGKTSLLVKIAARYGVGRNRPTLLVSADTCRVGGADQLASFAAILGVPFAMADTPGALIRTTEEHERKSLILIDIPGFGPADDDLARNWAGLIGSHPRIETHLVLPATHRTNDLRRLMRTWAPFRPAHLALTRLDETSSFGPVLGAAMEAERPISFVSAGPAIPEDLEAPSPLRLAQLLLPAATTLRAAA